LQRNCTSVLLLLVAPVVAACAAPRKDIEEQRLRSPDDRVDAVLYRTPTDPLSSDILSIRLEPVGAKLEWDGVMLYATHTDSAFAMRWAADAFLRLRMPAATSPVSTTSGGPTDWTLTTGGRTLLRFGSLSD